MKQSKVDPCAFCKVVDEEVDNLVVTANDKEAFDVFYEQSTEEFSVKYMDHLLLVPWVRF